MSKPHLNLNVIPLEKFSSLNRLLRVTCLVLRAVDIFKGKRPATPCIQADEMNNATQLWIRHVQAEAYSTDNALQQVKNLVPVIDQNHVIRCRGRLDNLTSASRRPILLPKSSHFSKLIVSQLHRDNFHIGVSQTLALSRENYWIISGRSLVKSVLSHCSTCRKMEGGPYILPPMADLPPSRLKESRPFLNTGCDFLGPLVTKRKIDGKKHFFP